MLTAIFQNKAKKEAASILLESGWQRGIITEELRAELGKLSPEAKTLVIKAIQEEFLWGQKLSIHEAGAWLDKYEAVKGKKALIFGRHDGQPANTMFGLRVLGVLEGLDMSWLTSPKADLGDGTNIFTLDEKVIKAIEPLLSDQNALQKFYKKRSNRKPVGFESLALS